MDFHVSDPALLRSLKLGQQVIFEIAEESAGEYAIVHIQPADSSLGTNAHGGH
jgi:Cu(I)/Ag(I) efflux system membrane fusion protein